MLSQEQQELFQRQQNEIYPELGNELISLTPEHWNSFLLELVATKEGVSHSIVSEEGHRDIVTPSMELFEHTRRLELLFKQYGCMWLKAKFHVFLSADGGWKFTMDYQYPA
ncbi:MAG: hypothetical protein HPY82_18900 [Gammaproteobacteria bacterium]|nr:hypothetical protein [Gammaproteobacteria bacterium]